MTAEDHHQTTTDDMAAPFKYDENIIFLEEYLSKPQPPTPSVSTSTVNSNDDGSQRHGDDLFYRLQKENARLPPQDSTAFILAQIERQNVLLEKDPKSIYIQSNELKAHFSTVQRLVKDNIDDDEEQEEIDWGFWEAVIQDSDQVALKLPHLLSLKLRSGIPSKVRGLMWQAMSKSASLHLETVYEQLCKEKSPHERIIQRDLARTFPRIEMFKQENGQGQTSMKKILEAYSLYDTDVGYCQGLAFLVGPLLLNMPETQSFCVFVRLMETYEMRSMFTLNMEGLQLRLYQVSSLLKDIVPNLSLHLSNSGVHCAMYASQWFLTLFAYVFPMNLVTRIYDIIFAEGAAETIMRVAIAMLKRSQDEIIAFTEFEDILDFVTTKKLCGPYTENYSIVIRDAMALSDIITRDKMDQLSAEYDRCNTSIDQQLVVRSRFNFWKRKGGSLSRGTKQKPDMKRSASAGGNGGVDDLPPVLLRKRWSSVSSRRDLSPITTIVDEKTATTAALDQLKQQHQKALGQLAELKFDKQDLECERDALKLTIVELERRRAYHHPRSYSIDSSSTKKPPPVPFLLKRSTKPIIVQCDDTVESPRSLSDLAVASKDDDSSIAISRQNSIHQSMLSSSDYTTTEFDDDELSLSLTTTTVPNYGDEEELSSQLVQFKVKNFELEQQIEKLNQDIELVTSKFDMVNEGQMALVDKLMAMKAEMDEFVLETKHKNEALDLANSENDALKQDLEDVRQSLGRCRLENGVLSQDLQLLKSGSELSRQRKDISIKDTKTSIPKLMRRHSTSSSSMLTVVRNKQIQELEEALTTAKIKLAEYESTSNHQQQQQQQPPLRKKSWIYDRVLHAIKYNNNS